MDRGRGDPLEGVRGDCAPPEGGGPEAVERGLLAADVDFVRERFRLPAFPQISPVAGFLACAVAGGLLSSGRPAASFLLAVAGAVTLLLDAYGFSPLNWLGPREIRCVLVVRGTPAAEGKRAFFFGLPLRCRLSEAGYFSVPEAVRRTAHAAGLALAFLLCTASGLVLLVYLPPLPVFGAACAAAMLLFCAAEGTRPARSAGPSNPAALWAGRLAAPADAPFRPFLLVYSGDAGEVKYFLSRHRGALLRGSGVFLEFAPEAEGPPAASAGEGPFIPYRTDGTLLSLVRTAGRSSGIPSVRTFTIRDRSAGLCAMARGFRAVTLFRRKTPSTPDAPFSEESAFAWAAEIARAAGAPSLPDLTGVRKKV